MNNKQIITVLLLLVFQGAIAQTNMYKDTLHLRTVNVWANRKIEHIGVTRTKIDSIVLHESICNTLSEVLSQNTTIFIKNYGRGSMATASFRGTAPSHTQVTWNGMKLNSPMLGMVDFSLIPSYFIDDMTLLHGAGSVDIGDGALGGAIVLNNKQILQKEKLQIIQGIASYNTYDTYLKYKYGTGKLKLTTRLYNVYSKNNFPFYNMDKNLKWKTDSKGNNYKSIDGAPRDRNKNGKYRNTHLLQEAYYKLNDHHHFSLITWAYQSERSIPTLTVSWDDNLKLNTNSQEDVNLRTVASWKWINNKFNMLTRLGYSYNELNYTLTNKVTTGYNSAIDSKSTINNIYSEVNASYNILKDLKITTKLNYNLFNVDTYEKVKRTGYKKYRAEVSPYLAIRYRAFDVWGIAYNIRKTINNDVSSPFIHAFLTDLLLWSKYNIVLKSSIVKNYHAPTLNDLYFQPGGNPDLLTEEGTTYDCGIEFQKENKNNKISGSATYYHSDISNWIIWTPTFKGYWVPKNVRKVISNGIELKLTARKKLGAFHIFMDANWGQTISTNHGDKQTWGDESVGKQLVYIPKYSTGLMTKLTYKNYFISHKFNHYSERFTTSSNDTTERDRLEPLMMNDISIGTAFNTKIGHIDLTLAINNLFNEKYQSVLKRPMPMTNYNLLISLKL